jgi:hypothetical protein
VEQDALALIAFAGTAAAGLALASAAALRGWNQWLALRRLEVSRGKRPAPGELRALRERVRRLEAIASGTEL